MTDKTKKAFNNAIASAKMEGFNFTDEQLESLADLIEQVDNGKMSWREAINTITTKYRRMANESKSKQDTARNTGNSYSRDA